MSDPTYDSELIDLRAVFHGFWLRRWPLAGIILSFGVAGVLIAILLPDVYESEIVAMVSDPAYESANSLPSGLGSLASMVGVQIPTSGSDKGVLAIETMRSDTFLANFVKRGDIKPLIFAVERWIADDKEVIWDRSIYDPDKREWVREVSPPREPIPSAQEAVETLRELLEISFDPGTRLVRVSVETKVPWLSAQIASGLVSELNRTLRSNDKRNALRRIEYLQEQISATSVAELRKALFALIEREQRYLMLAEVEIEYVLKVIDQPVSAEQPSGPNRLLIVFLAVFLGGVIAFCVAIGLLIFG